MSKQKRKKESFFFLWEPHIAVIPTFTYRLGTPSYPDIGKETCDKKVFLPIQCE
jgi:hypothetical protein